MLRRSLLAAPLVIPVTRALGQTADEPVRIGVLADESGPFRDISGYGARAAVELAVEDFGGKVGRHPIEIVHADHQNKPDVGTAILRRWFDTEGVDVVTDLSISSVALAAQSLAREKRKTLLITGGGQLGRDRQSVLPVRYAMVRRHLFAGPRHRSGGGAGRR